MGELQATMCRETQLVPLRKPAETSTASAHDATIRMLRTLTGILPETSVLSQPAVSSARVYRERWAQVTHANPVWRMGER